MQKCSICLTCPHSLARKHKSMLYPFNHYFFHRQNKDASLKIKKKNIQFITLILSCKEHRGTYLEYFTCQTEFPFKIWWC